MITLEQAIKLATEAHKEQSILITGPKHNSKKPFIKYILTLINMLDADEEKIITILYFLIDASDWELYEDAGWYIKNSEKVIKVPFKIYLAVRRLIRPKPDKRSYTNYIRDIASNKLATKVKIAIIVRDLSEDITYSYKQKYLKAIPILLKSL